MLASLLRNGGSEWFFLLIQRLILLFCYKMLDALFELRLQVQSMTRTFFFFLECGIVSAERDLVRYLYFFVLVQKKPWTLRWRDFVIKKYNGSRNSHWENLRMDPANWEEDNF